MNVPLDYEPPDPERKREKRWSIAYFLIILFVTAPCWAGILAPLFYLFLRLRRALGK